MALREITIVTINDQAPFYSPRRIFLIWVLVDWSLLWRRDVRKDPEARKLRWSLDHCSAFVWMRKNESWIMAGGELGWNQGVSNSYSTCTSIEERECGQIRFLTSEFFLRTWSNRTWSKLESRGKLSLTQDWELFFGLTDFPHLWMPGRLFYTVFSSARKDALAKSQSGWRFQSNPYWRIWDRDSAWIDSKLAIWGDGENTNAKWFVTSNF